MKQYFKEQLENKDLKPISKEMLEKLKGRSYYSEYQEGDIVVAFFKQTPIVKKSADDIPGINMEIHIIVEREINRLVNDFKFISMSTKFPVLERIIND